MPVDTVERYLAKGATTDELLLAFPVLQPGDIEGIRERRVDSVV